MLGLLYEAWFPQFLCLDFSKTQKRELELGLRLERQAHFTSSLHGSDLDFAEYLFFSKNVKICSNCSLEDFLESLGGFLFARTRFRAKKF